ncbi:MAG: hypothetical protein EOO91_15145 [Pedobacter sp.]|nr:MAG: hypothetical protein EOO91_15145 [Pedobacter sp.]
MRKYLKYIVALVLVLISVFMAKAQTSGTGCKIGSAVYTTYLGTAPYYGNNSDIVKVYSNSTAVSIITGNGYSGYQCGKINIYSAGTRYNSATNTNDPYPAVNEILATVSTNSCMVSSSLGVSSGGKGDIVQYTYNNPTYCGGSPMPLPLDDYNWAIIGSFALLGGFLISKNKIAIR